MTAWSVERACGGEYSLWELAGVEGMKYVTGITVLESCMHYTICI